MNKTLSLAFAIPAVIFTFSAHCENDWYLGAQYSAQEVTSLPDRDFNTLGIIAGYQYNQFLSFETRFSKGISGYSDPLYVSDSTNAEYKEDIDNQASFFIKASYPIISSFNVYALAGMTKSKYEITTTLSQIDIEGNTTTTYPHMIKKSESGFSYGVGLSYQVYEYFYLFIDYQVLPELEIVSGGSLGWKSSSFGVNYAF